MVADNFNCSPGENSWKTSQSLLWPQKVIVAKRAAEKLACIIPELDHHKLP